MSCHIADENLKLVSELECVTHLMTAVQTHIKHAKVVKNACMALTCLVEPDGKTFSWCYESKDARCNCCGYQKVIQVIVIR